MASAEIQMAEAGTPFTEADRRFMERAIELARQGELRPGGSPIGCVIVRDGEIIGEGYNETELRCDPTAHGEMVAMRQAGARIGQMELRGATLYSTLQPCGMCSMASVWAKIGRIVYGAERRQVHEMYFENRNLSTEDYLRDAYRDDLAWQGGLLSEECAALYVGPDEDVPLPEQVNR
jgi:tRNA(adenine34) deaminase